MRAPVRQVVSRWTRRHPERIGPSFRRTQERREAEWKALYGADQDVMFRQIHQPGRMGLSDVGGLAGLGVIVGGRHLKLTGRFSQNYRIVA